MRKQNKKKGQMTVEMVLILTVLILLSYKMRDVLFNPSEPEKNALYKFVTAPWQAVLVMMESGIWETKEEKGRELHPNNFNRMQSEKGITPP